MVDIHSHILPGLDDGSTSQEESIAMVRMAVESGTTVIVATPHASSRYRFDFDAVREKASELRANVPEMAIHTGCDFHLSFDNLENALKHPRRYTINQQQYLLVEFPDMVSFTTTPQIFGRLRSAGMIPIITHPERNAFLHGNVDEMARWVEEGAYVQVTAQSFLGLFGRRARDSAHKLMKQGLVHFVASDAHDLTERTTRLRESYNYVSHRFGEPIAEQIFDWNPAAVIAGEILPVQTVAPRKRWGGSSYFVRGGGGRRNPALPAPSVSCTA
jgi:protein-tyrosine phosphatase